MEQDFKNLIEKIPNEVSHVTNTLEKGGYEAYLVGGCVRDLLMDREPKDWDVTTNATPEQIISLFEKTVYENTFGTVGVCIPIEFVTRETSSKDVIYDLPAGRQEQPEYKIIEVTPYRIEAKYSDFRHPDEVKYSDKLEDDLKRRDFTMNAIAYGPADAKALAGRHKGQANGHIVDLYEGVKDIESKTIRTVGNPDDRFMEDALRMLRAVRFACQLDFSVAYETTESILKNAELIKKISSERIHDELVKILTSKNLASGILMLQKLKLLKNIIPELEEGIGCEQSGEHFYDVWNHALLAGQHAANKNWPLEIRLAALFHDIGKPRTRGTRAEDLSGPRFSGSLSQPDHEKSSVRVPKKKYTFYGHEVVGARMAKKIMERLKFPRKETELVEKLIRNHMFFSDTGLITLSAVRRIIKKVGVENIWLLMDLRECDRVGMKKKEAPYRLRKYFAMVEEALRDPISVNQLKIDGEFMMKELGIKPGPRMGWMLHALLEEVLDAPEKNTIEHLSELVRSLNMLGDAELKTLGERGKEKKEELEEKEVEKLHSKHGVKK
ncbi:MAG TPA: HD domain-containing protein [Candidatus Paceibacterota bacterium]